VTARNSPRGRARSRKRRARSQAARQADAPGAGARATAALDDAPPAASAPKTVARARKQPAQSESALYSPRGVGERPRAPWHPVPVSELLILVGAIGAAIGYSRESAGAALTLVSLAAVLIGTLEFTLREHLSGYRSHTIIIAVIAVAAFHSIVALTVAAFTHVPRAVNVGLIALDIALFAVLFKFLRARFLDARRERVFAGGR
jgi:hypothetical protein